MTGNHMMDYYVQPRHLYSHSRTCTHSGFCRRPSRLVASLICYLLDRASVHEISALVTCSSICQIFPATMEIGSIVYLQPLWRSWSFVYLHDGDSDLFILYVEMTTYVLSCFMPIHGHCTLMYPGLLYLFAVMCRVVSLYSADWMVGSSTGFFITSLLGWTYNVFWPSYDPLTSHIRGHIL